MFNRKSKEDFSTHANKVVQKLQKYHTVLITSKHMSKELKRVKLEHQEFLG